MSGVLLGEIQYIYFLELQRSRNAIVVLDKEATKFFVKDFNPRTKLLWVSFISFTSDKSTSNIGRLSNVLIIACAYMLYAHVTSENQEHQPLHVVYMYM